MNTKRRTRPKMIASIERLDERVVPAPVAATAVVGPFIPGQPVNATIGPNTAFLRAFNPGAALNRAEPVSVVGPFVPGQSVNVTIGPNTAFLRGRLNQFPNATSANPATILGPFVPGHPITGTLGPNTAILRGHFSAMRPGSFRF